MTTHDRFSPQTTVEREILAECEGLARMHDADVAEVLADALRYWRGSGRSTHPRLWQSRAAAAERLIARGRLIAEFTTAGLDPFAEIPRLARMTAEQMTDQIAYLADYQG